MSTQKAGDRVQRLMKGQCPIHGLAMSQTGGDQDDERVFECGCPREGCGVKAVTLSPDGPVFLKSEWAHLIDGDCA